LRLSDSEYLAEVCLCQIKTANFADAATDSLEVRSKLNILLDYITYDSVLFSVRIATPNANFLIACGRLRRQLSQMAPMAALYALDGNGGPRALGQDATPRIFVFSQMDPMGNKPANLGGTRK
jgi:hypothetical protein